MARGSADTAVVVVKLDACEDTVTCQRIKHLARDRDVKGKGRYMLMCCSLLETASVRLDI